MYDIIPLILIVLSLGVIIFIITRKFPALSSLDINSIQAEKEAKFKEKIISNRLKRNFQKVFTRTNKILRPAGEAFGNFSKLSWNKLLELKDKYKNEKKIPVEMEETKLKSLFLEVEEANKNNDTEKAEKILIEIIGLDSKNIRAFKMLGDLYVDRKNYEEAKQTLNHILRLCENQEINTQSVAENSLEQTELNREISSAYFNLSLISQALDSMDEAEKNLKKALDIDPKNPRYLDTMIEISIIKKDKALALETSKRLAEVNPENQKLDEIRKRIEEL